MSPESASFDLDPGAFGRRVRVWLSALPNPALCRFSADEVLEMVSGQSASVRLRPHIFRLVEKKNRDVSASWRRTEWARHSFSDRS